MVGLVFEIGCGCGLWSGDGGPVDQAMDCVGEEELCRREVVDCVLSS